jgi:transposase InsO family protein
MYVFFARHRGKNLFFKFCSDSFRHNGAIFTCGHGQEDGKFLAEIFYTLKEAKTLIEKWRMEYNTFRPHSSLNYRPPAPEAYLN